MKTEIRKVLRFEIIRYLNENDLALEPGYLDIFIESIQKDIETLFTKTFQSENTIIDNIAWFNVQIDKKLIAVPILNEYSTVIRALISTAMHTIVACIF